MHISNLLIFKPSPIFTADGMGELSGMIDGISCAIEQGKWNPESPIMFFIKYPQCANTSPGWLNYTDTLFVNVSRLILYFIVLPFLYIEISIANIL